MVEILRVDCGTNIHILDEDTVDLDSAGTDLTFNEKPPDGYIIYAKCPRAHTSLHINLKVPEEINLEDVHPHENARKLILSGTIYPCNLRGTIKCPLTPKRA